jgi:chromosome segregation ATPase
MVAREETDEAEKITTLMSQINQNLEGIGELRKRFNEVLEAVGSRMDTLEKRIEGIQTGGIAVDIAPLEDKLKAVEEHIEKLETKEHTHKDLQESIENAVMYTEKTEKLAQEDNKFLQGTYTEMKEHIRNTDERLKEMNKQIMKTSMDNEKTNRFRLAIKNFLKVVTED